MPDREKYKRLVARMKYYGYSEEEIFSAILLLQDLDQGNIKNLDGFYNILMERLENKEQYLDIWIEGKTALTLAFNNFNVTYNPLGNGPDLLAEDFGHQLYVEVKRYREDWLTRRKLEEATEKGTKYGRGQRDVEKLIGDVLKKTSQLPRGEIDIVFIRSDNITIEEVDFKLAMHDFDEMVRSNPVYRRISGILFDSGWVNIRTGQRFYLHLNPQAEKPLSLVLAERLRNLEEPPPHSRDEIPFLMNYLGMN